MQELLEKLELKKKEKQSETCLVKNTSVYVGFDL